MKLEHAINDAVYSYPSLFRANERVSRLEVFDQMFAVLGNGYEWNEKGYLELFPKATLVKTLPEGFYEKDLYDVLFPHNFFKSKRLNEGFNNLRNAVLLFIEYLKSNNRFYYIRRNMLVFESPNIEKDHEKYMSLLPDNEYSIHYGYFSVARPYQTIYRYVKEAKNLSIDELHRLYASPYELSEYSALVEVLNKKASPYGNPLPAKIKDDWMAGMVEFVKDLEDYYNNEERFTNHYSNPKSPFTIYSANERKSEKSMKQWEKFRKEQIKIVNKFLKEYA